MKCVMCGSLSTCSGIVVYGIENEYRICKKCLNKYKTNHKIEFNEYVTENAKTRQIRKNIQEEIDEKLEMYLLEV